MLQSFVEGFSLFFNPITILLNLMGVIFGLILGALPGLGPLMGIILMLPIAVTQPPVTAMGFLIAIFVAGSCGGSVSAILLRVPGTPLAAATLYDGYPMAQKGRASDAVGIAISASSMGGIIGGIILIFFSPMLARIASNFAPPEYAALAVMGLIAIAVISDKSFIQSLIAGCVGLLIATVGTDVFTTGYRFTFGNFNLLNGFHIVPVVVGLFAVSEMAFLVAKGGLMKKPDIKVFRASFRAILLTLKHYGNLIRSSVIGAFFGAIPGAGGVTSSFTAYAISKTMAKPHEKYGEGEEGGIVSTEAANNATVGGALVPTLALGIPGDAATAVLLGALLILGLFPGPALFEQNQDIVGGIFFVYIVSNIFLLLIGIIATPAFVYVLRIRKTYLVPMVLLLCAIGTYALQASVFDLWVMLAFGLLGILFRLAKYPLAPTVIGTVLGPILETNYRRAMLLTDEGLLIFLQRPVSAVLVVINILLIIGVFVYNSYKKRKQQQT
ncbi:MAG: tripartite tricarboxylate transporter permease [Spirochaetia bacterium]|nr:tripartite tricarboxylate transporter permease [Spirochaetia bacterium]